MAPGPMLTPELASELVPIAAKVFWWSAPDEALRDLPRFIAQVMTYGDWHDVKKSLRLLGEKAFEAVLDSPPSGVFDQKSWNYWHLFFGRTSVPTLPQRPL